MSAVFGGLIALQSMGYSFAMREFEPSIEWQDFYDYAVAEDVRVGVGLDTSGSWSGKGDYLAHLIQNVKFDDLDRQDNNFYPRLYVRVYLLIQAIEHYCNINYRSRFVHGRSSYLFVEKNSSSISGKYLNACFDRTKNGHHGKRALITLYNELTKLCVYGFPLPPVDGSGMSFFRFSCYHRLEDIRDVLSSFLLSFAQQGLSSKSLLHSEILKQQVMRITDELNSILAECQDDNNLISNWLFKEWS